MRHIPLLMHRPPDEWLQKAEKATRRVEEKLDPEERKALIEKNSRVWRDLKDWLLELSHHKCWFSEAKDCFQDWDVEHFRPKKSARNLDGSEREGYWWLSFDWKNLRVCGRVGNNKKRDYFPLASPFVADSVNRDIDEEVPFLLDPIIKADCVLLSFNQLGEAIPAPGLDAWSEERVRISVERYKLDFDKLVLRRKTIWETCVALLHEIQNLMGKHARNPGAAKKARIEEKVRQLAALTERTSECSSTAIACLLKSEVGWAVRLAAEASSGDLLENMRE